MPTRYITRFLHSEYFSAVLLLAMTVLALFFANSPFAGGYADTLHFTFGIESSIFNMKMSLLHWINDGLMAVFFLLVGLEIKREFKQGELSSPRQASLPILCAIGGVVAPALIFLVINRGAPENLNGWAIPTATDIAFALGLLSLGGKAVPLSLKVFLTALAIIDDLIAILIIALFYGDPLNIDAFLSAVTLVFILYSMNLMRIKRLWPYLLVGFLLWLSVLQSGIHSTIAGVLLALSIPVGEDKSKSPLHVLEEKLHPLSAYIIMPVFALANAGLQLTGLSLADVVQPLPLGILLALFLGKPMGIFLSARIAVKLGWAVMPQGSSAAQLFAVAVIAGIGFTMSLFIGGLAFSGEDVMNKVRLGVMVGSVLSAIIGIILLRMAGKPKAVPAPDTFSSTD